jgi:hypothetical protein
MTMVNVESLKESIGVDVILKPYFSSFTTFCLGGPCRSMIMCDRAKKLEDALL